MINDRETSFDFRVNLGGTLLSGSRKLAVSEVLFEERIKNSSRVEIIFDDHEGFDLGYDDVRLELPVNVEIGWRGQLSDVLQGLIINVDPLLNPDGTSQLLIQAYDWTYYLKKYTQMPEFYTEDSLLEIVRRVMNKYQDRYGFEVVIDPTDRLRDWQLTDEQASYRQEEKTDYEYLTGLAEMTDYILTARGTTLYFVDRHYFSRQFNSPRYTFYFAPAVDNQDDPSGLLLTQFRPRNRVRGQRMMVNVLAWTSVDEEGKRHGGARLEGIPGELNYTKLVVESERIEEITVLGESVTDSSAAHILAQSELQKRARRFVEGQCRCKGWPLIRMGQKHNFKIRALGNIGETFSGEYLITGVEHRWQSDIGYYTSFDVERDNLTETN